MSNLLSGEINVGYWIFNIVCSASGWIAVAAVCAQRRSVMNAFAWIAAGLLVLLLIYLFYALFKPERF
ncbi:K(+)-transporting ATPase subunit F [Chitinibacter sp. S2-10]|uniref:K(+)-transporting ATPase subunit F n=1 Tax=Chitinibacter sp. S2-10 TaxID=3373597 RepID=UPI0039777FEA